MVDWACKVFHNWGYKGQRIVSKSDQARAIVTFKASVASKREGEAMPKESPKYGSQSNGNAERAIRSWAAQFRTIKFADEKRIKRVCDMSDPIVSWMVRWAADVINMVQVKASGEVAYEMMAGRTWKTPITECGSQ